MIDAEAGIDAHLARASGIGEAGNEGDVPLHAAERQPHFLNGGGCPGARPALSMAKGGRGGSP